ncbi:MAG: T9SS type A sorting domain-containing protein [Candidatus Electryonea clarkiae]|nr:T9SS type A sorting domain-containing protein [Candidatus Electryonea clarkiae]MDP8287762.1 T9SS type A sorting domain-containing protein [Candidatus Electryonea clarkiae]
MRLLSFIITCITLASIPVAAQPPDTLWTRTFGGINVDTGHDVQQTNDGGFIIVGYTDSLDPLASDLWLIKTDSNGDEEWNQTFGRDFDDRGFSVRQTNDGGYIITGESWSLNFDDWYDVWLLKTDSAGNEEWNQTFGTENLDVGESVQQTSDGGYVIAGNTQTNYSGEDDAFLIKTDSTGHEVWTQTFGSRYYDDFFYSVNQTNDGGYIITGGTESSGDDWVDVWLIKTDSRGNEEWSRTFGGNDYEIGHSVQQTDDGGYIITGETWSSGAGRSDLWVVKTDSIGNEEWTQTFGGTHNEQGFSVQQTNDEGYIITGETWSFGNGWVDVWLIRLDNAANDIIETTLNIPDKYTLSAIYPNPFNSTTTISVGLPASSELKLNIFNITGQQVSTLANERYSPGYHKFTFNADELPSGIYFIHASVPGKMDEVRKVMLIR